MTARTYLVTGATDGIGQQTAKSLAMRGARVIVHGRNPQKAEASAEAIRSQTNSSDISAVAGDLSSLAEVHTLAESLAKKHSVIDVLINNAGVFANERKVTSEGFELTFVVNHLAPFLLTHLLLPQLRASDEPRVVNVSSIAHSRGAIDFDDLNMERGFGGYRAYAASKLMNVLFSFDLKRRLTAPPIAVNALHPGVIGTKLLREGFGMAGGSVETGAATTLYVATDPRVARVSGKYFSDAREVASAKQSHDQEAQERLYAISAKLTGIVPLPLA